MNHISKFLIFISSLLLGIVATILYFDFFVSNTIISPIGISFQKKDISLEKYSFPNLHKRTVDRNKITIGKEIIKTTDYQSFMYYFKSDGKKISGLMNIPSKPGTYPIIILFRGFVDKSIYLPGVGSSHVGQVLVKNGYITLAPDFLGYGESDMPSNKSIEERFQTYTTAQDLVTSITSLNDALQNVSAVKADVQKLGIWGHSNGGHIALATLTSTGKKIPTVLWAPVSKPFPYSILFFTDEFDDGGKALRKVVADFESTYDVNPFTFTNYIDWIKAPIQLNQGGLDDAVPIRWSNTLYKELLNKRIDVEYYTYPNADHNLAPDGWNIAVDRMLEFFKNRL
ncbi:MAG: prolyl oligopeptidase family serine peptidase [Candidatus Roizmanbacteria bacterium]